MSRIKNIPFKHETASVQDYIVKDVSLEARIEEWIDTYARQLKNTVAHKQLVRIVKGEA